MKAGQSYTIELPLSTMVGKKKYILNLNRFRNAHFQVNNKAKQNWQAEIAPQIATLPKMDRIKLDFHYYKPSRRKSDRANVLCIVEKFLCDCLVQFKVIEDDSDEYIDSTHYNSTTWDKENPRVEVIIADMSK